MTGFGSSHPGGPGVPEAAVPALAFLGGAGSVLIEGFAYALGEGGYPADMIVPRQDVLALSEALYGVAEAASPTAADRARTVAQVLGLLEFSRASTAPPRVSSVPVRVPQGQDLIPVQSKGAGSYGDVALGLGLQGDLRIFANRNNFKTYLDFFDDVPGAAATAKNLQSLLANAETLHFNLQGLRGSTGQFLIDDATGLIRPAVLEDITVMGREGVGSHNLTNWELAQVLDNPHLLAKTTFYDGARKLSTGGLP